MSLYDDQERLAPMGRIWNARLSRSVTDMTDPVYVIVPDFDETLELGPCRWLQLPGTLARGDECLLVFDNDRAPWIVSWDLEEPLDWAVGGGNGGGTGGDKNYVHTQGSPSATWSVIHNLAKLVAIEVVDTGDNVIIPNVHYDSLNALTLTFGAPTSGKAVCN